MLRRFALIPVLLLLLVAAVNPAFADEEGPRETAREKAERKSKNLPEVPIVLLYPAAGVLTYLGYRVIAARRERDTTAA